MSRNQLPTAVPARGPMTRAMHRRQRKPDCCVCKTPASDGWYQASLANADKLRALMIRELTNEHDVEDVEFPELKESDVICYACTWYMERLYGSDGDDSVIWWPTDLKLDKLAKLKKKHYVEGRVDPCWIKVEKVQQCQFCESAFACLSSYRRHVRQQHLDNSMECPHQTCHVFFSCETEMKAHYELEHRRQT